MSKSDNIEETARFDHLLDLYLSRKADEAQQQALRTMVENGFGDRFQQRFEEVINSEVLGEEMDEQTRQEILTNIFNRNSSAETLVRADRFGGIKWFAAAAAIIIVTIGAWYFTTGNQQPETGNQTLSVVEATGPQIYSGKQYVKLTDGSTILLTDSSQLTVSEDFNQQTRTVSLIGKAYFDIAHNANKKFQIITGDITTTVLGTAFSIDTKSEQSGKSMISVVVTRGKVQVGDTKKVYGTLTRDQQININTLTHEHTQTSINAEKVTEWKKDYLIFDNVTMEVAAAIIKEKYNVNVAYSTDAIKHCDFTATFLDGENLDQVLEVISTLAKVNYEILPDGNVKLIGEGCNPAP